MAKRDDPVDAILDELASLTGRSRAEIKLAAGVVVTGVAVAALLRVLDYIAKLGPRPGRGPAHAAAAVRAVIPGAG
jgi:hypothetical protein